MLAERYLKFRTPSPAVLMQLQVILSYLQNEKLCVLVSTPSSLVVVRRILIDFDGNLVPWCSLSHCFVLFPCTGVHQYGFLPSIFVGTAHTPDLLWEPEGDRASGKETVGYRRTRDSGAKEQGDGS
jgi:hypothetical protein